MSRVFCCWKCKSSPSYTLLINYWTRKAEAFNPYTMNISFKRAILKWPGRWGLENWQFRVIALTGSYLTMLPNRNWRHTTKCQAPILPEICHCKLYLVNLFIKAEKHCHGLLLGASLELYIVLRDLKLCFNLHHLGKQLRVSWAIIGIISISHIARCWFPPSCRGK